MLNESFTQHMDAIKSCSTKQQCSIKVYLRDILHPYVNLQSGFFWGGGGGRGKIHSITYSIFPPPLPPQKIEVTLTISWIFPLLFVLLFFVSQHFISLLK